MGIGILYRTVLFVVFFSAVDWLFNDSLATNTLTGSVSGLIVYILVFAFGLSLGEYVTQQRKKR